tara:strand:+ start:133 stop:1107 length:975 start_codon:yes stop_codon:yes gene_type:complete
MRLDQLKEENIEDNPQYKSWLKIYKKSKDAAEAHPKHAEFLKYYNSQTKEGLADMADMVEKDHEVQMARSDLYKIAKYSIKLHEMLKKVSEAEGIEGWMQSKITKAADYMGSVFHALDYETKFYEKKEVESSYKDMLSKKLEESKDKTTKESGLQYYTGVKKYGKDGMKAIQSAAGKGANHEEIGKIKDKHDKRKKNKKVTELEHGKVYSSGGKKFRYNAKAKGDELAMVPVDDNKDDSKVVTSRTTDGKMKKFKMSKKGGLTPLEESVGKLITEDEFERLAEKKDACYHKVKARYKVWPSAYASGALVQCRKKGAKNWGNSKK